MLKDEMIEILDLFNSFGIPEVKQREIIIYGVDFNFTWGDPDYGHRNRKFDVFEFADLLKMTRNMNMDLDINKILEKPYEYEDLIKAYSSFKSLSKKLKK